MKGPSKGKAGPKASKATRVGVTKKMAPKARPRARKAPSTWAERSPSTSYAAREARGQRLLRPKWIAARAYERLEELAEAMGGFPKALEAVILAYEARAEEKNEESTEPPCA